MKTLKAICTAGILALALSIPASAGDVQTPGSPCPGTSSIGTPDPCRVLSFHARQGGDDRAHATFLLHVKARAMCEWRTLRRSDCMSLVRGRIGIEAGRANLC